MSDIASQNSQQAMNHATQTKVGLLSIYKSKAEKKKARQARRKKNRAIYSRHRAIGPEAVIVTGTGEKPRDMKDSDLQRPFAKTRSTSGESLRSSAKKYRHLAVAVSREDGVPVDKSFAKLIRTKVVKLIEEIVLRAMAGDRTAVAPQFAMSGLVAAGYFLVTPATTESREWLMGCDFGLLEGKRIVTTDARVKEKEVRNQIKVARVLHRDWSV